jgi:TRAP-type mannitol/chloroaromatic compound transport system permease large subunit
MHGTMRLTAMVVFILIGSRVFSQVFQGVDGAIWVEHLLTGLPGGAVGFMIVVNIFVFFLAFFLDFFEIAFIIVPLLAPVAAKVLAPLFMDATGGNVQAAAHYALIWFGVVLCVNLQTSFMHPPFGFALFYLRGIADTLYKEKRIPKPVLSNDIYLGAIPWVLLQLVLVAVVIFVPQTVTVFLDKEVAVDIDKVNIEMPVESPGVTEPAAGAPAGTASDPFKAAEPGASADEEQKKIDDLFKK